MNFLEKLFVGFVFCVGILDTMFGAQNNNVILAISPFILPAIIGAGATLGSGFLGNKQKNVEQVPLETPEQREARQALLQLARTGIIPTPGAELQLGEDIGIQTGGFDLTPFEEQGFSQLSQLIGSALPESITEADSALVDLLQDPTIDPAGQFAPFKARVEREIRDRSDDLKRQSAFLGDLFSTNTVQQLGDVQARGTETLTQQLADLTNQALNRRLSAAQSAPAIASLIESINKGRIGDLFQFGSLPRNLALASQEAQNQELLRQRNESLQRVNALQTVSGAGAPFGVPSLSVPQVSPFQEVLNLTARIGGDLFSNELLNRRLKNQQSFVNPQTGGTPTAGIGGRRSAR